MSFSEVLREDDLELEYRRRRDEEKNCVSYGQRKLLLSLVSFLSKHCRDIENAVILYAGAAPGLNIGIAASLFPKFSWHLYDPARFGLTTNMEKKIFVYRKYFDDEVATYWAGKQNIIFISDIRTADYTKAKNLDENEDQIEHDMEMQRKWVEIIRPIRCQLKFRLSYTLEGRKNEFEYFDGIIYKQPFAPQTSTETRLVLSGKDLKYKIYDCNKYEKQLFYHNVVVRETNKYDNPEADGVELVNDWDSKCEVTIWKDFLGEKGNKDEILRLSIEATRLLNLNKKVPDTLSYLRSNPRAIKNRNFKKKNNHIKI
jgi:hypothetical protein